ncbi:unnamed protein product [Clavelina lepadiformis]|uniref:Golgin subfamily A conserved domain-containing protein n=1 Tax=Clavelina lepadiformis TaxID=159417 RepID=A0ABP0F7V1_CLALP
MPGAKREDKIASAKRKLRQFKQKREKELKAIKDDTSSVASEDSIVVDANPTERFPPLPLNNVNSHNVYNDSVPKNNDTESYHLKEASEISDGKKLSDSHTENGFGDATSEVADNNVALSQATLDNEVKILASSTEVKDDLAYETRNTEEVSDNLPPDEAGPTTSNSSVTVDPQTGLNNDLTPSENKPSDVIVDDHVLHGSDSSSAAATESLLQISTKLNGLATEAQSVMENYTNGDSAFTSADRFVLSELEHRNQQLAEHASTVTRQKQELMVQVEKLTQQMTELQHRLENEKQQIYAHGINEQNTLRQQLQVQMQTIGILVAEKQELQHQVHEARASADRDQHSRHQSQDQLQDAKLKLQTLERELALSSESIELLNATKSDLTEERNHLQVTVNKLSKLNDELDMHSSELGQKLFAKEGESDRLRAELADLHEKLSMAEVLLQQFSNASGITADGQLKQLQEERESLNQKLIEVKVALDLYQQAFEQLTGEREQLSRQYDDVNKQMQTQVSELTSQIELLENEKVDLHDEQERLNGIIQDLEAKNTNLLSDKDQSQSEQLLGKMSEKLQNIESKLERVTAERDELNHKLHVQISNNERLARLHEEQEMELAELNRNAAENTVSTEEHARLLEQLQSEKTTISRALTQNKQLKRQLEEMHEGFIKLSNDKMELASHLTTVEHARNELQGEIESYKAQLLATQERLIENDNTVTRNEQELASSIEVEDLNLDTSNPSNVALQEELVATHETITLLGEQNNELKAMVTRLQSEVDVLQESVTLTPQASPDVMTIEHEIEKDNSKNGTMVEVLTTSIHQLEEERNYLTQKFEEQQQQHGALMEQLLQLQQHQKDSHEVSLEEHQSLKQNMSLLQERFSTVMREKVDAMSKVEELEHINLQLQTECDTIGEYITLYHNQRQILKQRHHEKDEYVSSMAQEREKLQIKLEKLQSLVLTLLNSRGITESDTSLHQLASTPSKHNPATINTATTQLDESVLAGFTSQSSEWPSMLEDDQRHQHRPDLLLEHPPQTSTPSADDPIQNPSPHNPQRPQDVEKNLNLEENKTANQIMDLLEQIQKPSPADAIEVPQGFCLRYMGPYTAI